jgi:hypothetical protein
MLKLQKAVDIKSSEIIDGSTTTNSRYIKITFEITQGAAGDIPKMKCSLDGQPFT